MKVAFHTLGCKVNQYETEAIKMQFINNGYEVISDKEFSDIYIINTCSVTSLADRKSRQYIRRVKKINPEAIVVVTGCYAEVSSDEVSAIEGVNIVVGTDKKIKIIEYIEEYIKHNYENIQKCFHNEMGEELLDWNAIAPKTYRTRAYVKIQDGCNKFCSYCIIPYARGNVRSRKLNEVMRECQALIDNGVKEIILTGINTALCENLYEILDRLDNIHGDFRIRLSSLEPTVINVNYVKRLFKFKKLCHHLHLSLQSGSDKILKSMNRSYNQKEYLEIVQTLKEFDSNYGITTDIITGFPGENDDDFNETLKVVKEAVFCKVHTFKYSKRSGTPAANMENQVNNLIKKERSNRLIEEGNNASEKFFENNIGEVRKVIFEEYDEEAEAMVGYTDNYIRVYLEGKEYELEKYQNTLIDVCLMYSFRDGMKVKIMKYD